MTLLLENFFENEPDPSIGHPEQKIGLMDNPHKLRTASLVLGNSYFTPRAARKYLVELERTKQIGLLLIEYYDKSDTPELNGTIYVDIPYIDKEISRYNKLVSSWKDIIKKPFDLDEEENVSFFRKIFHAGFSQREEIKYAFRHLLPNPRIKHLVLIYKNHARELKLIS